VVCLENLVSGNVRVERGWRVLRVAGVIDFSVVGLLAGLIVPPSEAGISVFGVSTYDTNTR
jgi:hypothetical protein